MRLLSLLALLALAPVLPPEREGDPPETVAPERLGGDSRPVAHVTTDKPIYREGETLFARAVVLDALTRHPAARGAWLQCEVLGPRGESVLQSSCSGEDGVVPFSWTVPAGQAGGLYRLRFGGPGFVPGERSFEVRAFRAPRIKSQIVFIRDGFGPGDEVTAFLEATRAEGGAPAGAGLTLVAVVDGSEVARQPAGALDELGRATVRFRLPATIERGEGTLALVMEDGGVVETASKTIPILLRRVDLAAFPEGGVLVAGLPSRVYVQARTPADKPADVAGVIETGRGEIVARFRTEHEGRGRVRLTPEAGTSYRLRITEPAGVETVLELPEVRAEGGVIATAEDVAEAGRPLRLRVGATAPGTYEVAVSLREKEIARERVSIGRGQLRPLALSLPEDAGGVLRVTLWDGDGWPVAERLAFRRPAGRVDVELSSDRERYVPGGRVELRVRTTDENGAPVSAMVGLSVSDDAVRELLETRDQPPALPAQVLLETEVIELADPAAYLAPDDPRAPLALDLLLGTQGWRRFAFVADPQALVQERGDAARRALAMVEQAARIVEEEADAGFVQGALAMVRDKLARLDRPVPPMELGAARPAALMKDDGLRLNEAVALPASAPAMPVAAGVVAQLRAEPQRAGKREGFAADEMDFREAKLRRQAVQAVRLHAHVARPNRQAGERVDFADTVYWNAGVRTDASGEALVSFDLSDSVTSFRVLCDAFTGDGALGAGTRLIDSVEPFYVEPKLPLEVSSGDVVRLPVTAVNGTTERLDGASVRVSTTGPLTVRDGAASLALPPDGRVRTLTTLHVGAGSGTASVTIDATAGSYRDSVTRTLKVVPLGFPSSLAFGGMLGPGASVTHELVIPKDVVAGSVSTSGQAFPTSLGKLTGALERLIQEPYGCFEQTSSTTYPLVMAQQYFTTHSGVDPALVTRSHEMLGKGHDRLVSFECTTKGYEWFGESPGHEALTAFGLLELTDMSRVRSVDPAMLARTREWLLSARDGKGGFKRERRALHTWIEDADCSNAYITWALLEAGEPAKGLGAEIEALARAAGASKNAYVHALAANVMQLAGRATEAKDLVARLASAQDASGKVTGATSSIVGSTGEALEIEATSLAALAWMRSPEHAVEAQKAVRFLAESCQGGRYGSTQSTVLALRAIVAHDAKQSAPRAPGRIVVSVDGAQVGEAVTFDETTDGALVLPDLASALGAGRHRVEIAMEGGSEMPYSLEVRLHRATPDSSEECPLTLAVSLSDDSLVEGEIGEAQVVLESRSDEPLPMAVAIVGLPGGLEPRHEQLKELVRARTVAAYEVNGREVVLYFRSLDPRASKRIPISVVAAVPGTYTGPASRAYLYYGDEHRTWVAGLRATVEAR